MHVDVTPQLIVALTSLVTAVTALVKLFLVDRKVTQTHEAVQEVKQQTNGTLDTVNARVASLEAKGGPPPSAPPADGSNHHPTYPQI